MLKVAEYALKGDEKALKFNEEALKSDINALNYDGDVFKGRFGCVKERRGHKRAMERVKG